MIRLRRAAIEDAESFYEWVNSPDSLANKQKTTSAILWNDHYRWFERVVSDPNIGVFVIVQNGDPAGQIRFDKKAKEISIDIYIEPSKRAFGLASRSFHEAVEQLGPQFFDGCELVAVVKRTNIASKGLFQKLGFTERDHDPDFFTLTTPGSAVVQRIN